MPSKTTPEPPKRRNRNPLQSGSTEIPDNSGPSGVVSNGGDNVLEPEDKHKQKLTLIPASDLDKMIADSMQEIGSDEDLSDDDPELLQELSGIVGDNAEPQHSNPAEEGVALEQQVFLPTTTINTISIIKNRIEMYKLAESVAETSGESAKERRLNRGLKTLNDLLQQSVAGHTINVDDIPPEVIVKSPINVAEPIPDETENPKLP